MNLRVGVLTVSDKGSAGLRDDVSGQVIKDTVAAAFCEVARYEIVPDEAPLIARKLKEWADEGNLHPVS